MSSIDGKAIMVKRTWNEDMAKKRIATRLAEVSKIEIKDYVRDTDLAGLKNGLAYRVDGVHLYIDILNIDEMLDITNTEGERCHRRTLRFLNNHYRAVRNILLDVDAIQVDFHNQRLHAVFAKPYDDEEARIHKAVATAQLIRDVLARTGEDNDDPLPAAKTRVGIDSGLALAVNNGRRSSREPLFLGNPANQAAKRAGGGTAEGIFITNGARAIVGWDAVLNEDATALTDQQIEESENAADLDITADDVVEAWEDDLEKNPVGKFEFYRHTPPFQTLSLEELTPKNSRRQEFVSIYADIDNFTKFVADRIDEDDEAKDVVKTLHVLRSELDAVLYDDFAGTKVRFIGDCIHGILVEGTALVTDGDDPRYLALTSPDMTSEDRWAAFSDIPYDGCGIVVGLMDESVVAKFLGANGTEDIINIPMDNQQRSPEKNAVLANKRVAILGCGSMGSKVAASLARSGVGKFYLVDADLLKVGNLVRHELDWAAVGAHKVD